jgi:hypothetical protein
MLSLSIPFRSSLTPVVCLLPLTTFAGSVLVDLNRTQEAFPILRSASKCEVRASKRASAPFFHPAACLALLLPPFELGPNRTEQALQALALCCAAIISV